MLTKIEKSYLDKRAMLLLMVTRAPPSFKGMYAGKKSVSTASVHSSSVGSIRSWHIFNKVFSISHSIWSRKEKLQMFPNWTKGNKFLINLISESEEVFLSTKDTLLYAASLTL